MEPVVHRVVVPSPGKYTLPWPVLLAQAAGSQSLSSRGDVQSKADEMLVRKITAQVSGPACLTLADSGRRQEELC